MIKHFIVAIFCGLFYSVSFATIDFSTYDGIGGYPKDSIIDENEFNLGLHNNLNETTYFFPSNFKYQIKAGSESLDRDGLTFIGESETGTIIDFIGSPYLLCSGNNITLKNMSLRNLSQSSNSPYSILNISGDNITLDNIIFVGEPDTSKLKTGIAVLLSGDVNNLKISNCLFQNIYYCIFKDAASSSSQNGIIISNCCFTDCFGYCNFNSPNGAINNVIISNSIFKDNHKSPHPINPQPPQDNFGVALANTHNVIIEGCTFDGFERQAIHCEDRSKKVIISNNTFTNCGSINDYFSGACICALDCIDINVMNNTFDLTGSQNIVNGVTQGKLV